VGKLLGRDQPPSGMRELIAENDSSINRILVVRTVHSLGNFLGLTPLITELEKRFPGAEIDVVTGFTTARDLFRNFSWIGSIYQLPERIIRHPLRTVHIAAKLRGNHYDLVINPSADSGSGRLVAGFVKPRYAVPSRSSFPVCEGARHFARTPVYQLRHQFRSRDSILHQEVPPLRLDLSEVELR